MDDTLDVLIGRFAPVIRAKARQMLWMPGLAEDACQETILRVLQYFRSGKQLVWKILRRLRQRDRDLLIAVLQGKG